MDLSLFQDDFDLAPSRRPTISITCTNCNKVVLKSKHNMQSSFRHSPQRTSFFCSRSCRVSYQNKDKVFIVPCLHCDIPVRRTKSSKMENTFCSSSCAAKYNNAHKTSGTRVSKLEVWLQKQLPLSYPDFLFHFNRKDAINGELDIYIPNLKLAFELNGIFHYEPIYGAEKLASIQTNDTRKAQACLERGIELCIIDSSSFKYFKAGNAQKYLDIILKIIDLKLSKNLKLAGETGNDPVT
jgi:hypothetical protein